jgi:two-component system copper resistance phosphate regulon response regulator CusR
MLGHEIEMEKAPQTAPALPNRRLLVIGDDRDAQEMLSKAISSMGHVVAVADDGLEGLALFFAQAYDLVVVDIHMPFMDGWELSCILKKRFPDTPIVAVTEVYDDRHWAKQKLNCVDSIILKPFKLEEVEKTVQKLLNGGSYGRKL